MRSALVIAFILGTAAVGIYTAMLDTVIDGKVIEKRMLGILGEKGITSVTCDPAIPFGTGESVFQCVAADTTGATATLEMRMLADGGFKWKAIGMTDAPESR
jgi:hypothetical protein